MKSDFLIALTQLAAERNLPREIVLSAEARGRPFPRPTPVYMGTIVPGKYPLRTYFEYGIVDSYMS